MAKDPKKTQNDVDEVELTARLFNLLFDMPVERKIRLLNTLDQWENEGSRKHPRKSWIIPVEYAIDDQSFSDRTKDISQGGVFIETGGSFAVGQAITMTFRLPTKSRKRIQAAGEIVRSDSRGIGVRFNRQPRKRSG